LTEFAAAAVVVAGATDAAAVGLGVDVGVEDRDRGITKPDCSNIQAELSQELLSCDASRASCPVARDDPFWA
jgi:hypothetical protein